MKVTWTRDDDLHHDFFHTVSVERLQAGLDAQGKTTAWLHRSAAPSIISTFAPDPKQEAPFEQGMGLINVPFQVPNLRIENPPAAAHTRIGWFRSVSNVPHAFAVQCFVAELAAAAGRDHRDFLLDLIGPARRIDPGTFNDSWNHGESPQRYPYDTGRLRRVIETATREANWGRKLPQGDGKRRGLGLAAHYSFVSYVAVVVEVEVGKQGELVIPRVDIAFDCGPAVYPDRVRSQLEGAVNMGVSLAATGEITFKNGRAAAGQLPHLHADAHERSAARYPRAPDPGEGLVHAARRRGRTGTSGHRAGGLQRHLRGHRQAHPPAAGGQPASHLTRPPGSRAYLPPAYAFVRR